MTLNTERALWKHEALLFLCKLYNITCAPVHYDIHWLLP